MIGELITVPRSVCGAYIVTGERGIRYVGSAIDVHKRLLNHSLRIGPKDAVYVIECCQGKLSRLETLLIAWYDPPENGSQPGRNFDRVVSGKTLGNEEELRALITRVITP